MASLCFGVEHVFVAGLGIRSEGSPMFAALRPTRIKSLLFAVIDAIQSEVFPTLHQRSLNPPHLFVSKLSPVV